MNKKRILLAVFASVALLLLAMGIVTFAPPATKGRLTFTGFQDIGGARRAFFTYNPPKGLKRCWFIKCQCVTVLGDGTLGYPRPYAIPYETPEPRHFAVVCPEDNPVWRLRLVVVVKLKGIEGVIGRIRNAIIQKSLTAWRFQPVQELDPIYSLPVTNPAPGTLLPRTEQ